MDHYLNYLKSSSKTIEIYDRLLLVVGRHGQGKTNFLKEINEGKYTCDSKPEKIFHFGIIPDHELTLKILNEAKINDDESLNQFIKEEFNSEVVNILQERINYNNLVQSQLDGNLSYKRLIILAILQRMKVSNSLILIDEPELLAHPVIRQELMVRIRELQQVGNILVVATNLDNVIADLLTDPLQIVRLDLINGVNRISQIEINKLEEKVKEFYRSNPKLLKRFSNANQFDYGLKEIVENNYRSYLAASLRDHFFDILFSKVAIIGEGASEGILFDYVETYLHPNWIRDKQVTFINCLGKSTMPLYFLFLEELGLKIICMHDYDNDTNPVHVAYSKALKAHENNDPKHFKEMVIDPDLEGILEINPEYKLESIEKPVNIYINTFVSGKASGKVIELTKNWESIIKKMEQ